MTAPRDPSGMSAFRARLHEIVFEADTPAGKAFDVGLLALIVLSIAAVCLESVPQYRAEYRDELRMAEWAFTGIFTVEYLLRLISVKRPWQYARSFFGVVDLLAIVPTFLSVMVPGAHSFLVVRVLRLLRVFRVLKLANFVGQGEILATALARSRYKITVFLTAVGSVVVMMGALMYLVEGPATGFDSIPRGMYWAVVTMTTVGYGDIAPRSVTGQFLASLLMVLGYAVLAVPTGIVSVELAAATRGGVSTQACPSCGLGGHSPDAVHCKYCGEKL